MCLDSCVTQRYKIKDVSDWEDKLFKKEHGRMENLKRKWIRSFCLFATALLAILFVFGYAAQSQIVLAQNDEQDLSEWDMSDEFKESDFLFETQTSEEFAELYFTEDNLPDMEVSDEADLQYVMETPGNSAFICVEPNDQRFSYEPEPDLFVGEDQIAPELEYEYGSEELPLEQCEWTYVRLKNAHVYSTKPMCAETLEGMVTGIAFAPHYARDSVSSSVRVVFATEDGLIHKGVLAGWDVQVLDYQKALNEIGEDTMCLYDNNENWPMPAAGFLLTSNEIDPSAAREEEDAPLISSDPEIIDLPQPEDESAQVIPADPEIIEMPHPEDGSEQAIAQEGSAYVQLYATCIFSNLQMTSESSLGCYSGIALATVYYRENTHTGEPAALGVMFKVASGFRTGYVTAADVEVLDYDTARMEILDGADSNDPWPLAEMMRVLGNTQPVFDVVVAEDNEEDSEEAPAPYVTVTRINDEELISGMMVELRSEVFNLPADRIVGYKWMNNAGGEFREVPGATGETITFLASAENTGCEWIVEVLLI